MGNHNDLWKPQPGDVPVKRKRSNGWDTSNKKRKKRGKGKKFKPSFYTTPEWRSLRVKVLEKYECRCMMCGRSPKLHGIVVHVDHIKPRSKYPRLELVFDNCQILCECCNMGKSNKYKTDFRPDADSEIDDLLDIQLMREIETFQ